MNSYESDNPIFRCFKQMVGSFEKDIVFDNFPKDKILSKACRATDAISKTSRENYIDDEETSFYSPLMKSERIWKEKVKKLKERMK
ncbi:MAG: hypothetical protein ACLFS3_02935 [Candidatus Aenigmatarchaeota archaeon]